MKAPALAALLALTGCGAELDDGRASPYGPQPVRAPDLGAPPPDAAPADMTPDADTVTADDYTGTWAVQFVQGGAEDLPALGRTAAAITSLNRVEISPGPDPDTLHLATELCAVAITRETELVQTVVPAAYVEALPITERPATIDGRVLDAPWLIEVRGATLDDPEDPLPTEPDDPRVTDPDADGHPGLTVLSTGIIDGEIYIVQRARTRLALTLDGDTLDGDIEWRNEDSVLDADNEVLLEPVTVEPQPGASGVLGTRVDPELDCAALITNQTALFTR